MKQNIFYLGFCPSVDLMDDLYRLDSRPSVQTVKYAKKIISILERVGTVVNISTAPIQDYPKCKKLFIFTDGDYVEKKIFIPFINVLGLKQCFRFLFSLYYLILNANRGQRSIIVLHGVHLPFVLSAIISKIIGYKVVLYATDPAGVVLVNDGFVIKFLKMVDKNVINALLKFVDGAVVPSMTFIKNYKFRENIPFQIVPGIMEKTPLIGGLTPPNLSLKPSVSVCYSGSLYRNNGIENLIRSARHLPKNVNIHIVGEGEDSGYLEKVSQGLGNVFFHGFKSGSEYLELVANMDILVNVRSPTQDFTYYSFPSKLFEYLSLNKFVITTRLHSIPAEISGCFDYFDSTDPKHIANKIQSIIHRNKYKKVESNYSLAYEHYSADGVSRKINTLVSSI